MLQFNAHFHTTIFGHFWHLILVLAKGEMHIYSESEGENKANPEGLSLLGYSSGTLKLLATPSEMVLDPE